MTARAPPPDRPITPLRRCALVGFERLLHRAQTTYCSEAHRVAWRAASHWEAGLLASMARLEAGLAQAGKAAVMRPVA